MAHEIDLREHQTVSNTGAKDNDSVQVNFGIRINSLDNKGGGFDFQLFGPLIVSPELHFSGISNRSATEMFGLAEECRNTWKSELVDRKARTEVDGVTKFGLPFQDKWDFQDTGLLVDIVPRLARAGENLFTSIFEQNCDEGLKEIGQTIRRLMGSADQSVAITSDKLFQPWGMLYTHPVESEELADDGSNWVKNGFWGYRHIVQQTPKNYKHENCIQPDADGSIRSSVNFDDRLAISLQLPIIDQHIEFLNSLGAKIKRTKKSELEQVFKRNRRNLERILYFYCHGHGSGGGSSMNLNPPYLELTDGSVSAFDFQRWADGSKLPTSPLVFINACQGGQMTTMFYESFAVELLNEGAVGLIGTQIDVPAVFAVQYAKEIFQRFFDRTNTQKQRLGPLVKKVNQKLWDENNNPLGLVYSLYRGIDCFIDWSKTPVADALASTTPNSVSSS
jgi:hypothetical protein